jgi:hypothetical protein
LFYPNKLFGLQLGWIDWPEINNFRAPDQTS